MNKTPIQELIDDLTRRGVFLNPSKMTLLIKRHIDYWAEKEKQFAFECFIAGMDGVFGSNKDNPEYLFNKFYSQYAERESK